MPLTRAGAAVEHASLARYPLRNAQAAIRRVWTGYTRRLGLDAATRTDGLVCMLRYVGARILGQSRGDQPGVRDADRSRGMPGSGRREDPRCSAHRRHQVARDPVPGGWSWVRRSPCSGTCSRRYGSPRPRPTRWLGSPSFRLPRSDASMLPPGIAHAELVAALTDQLYRDSRPWGGSSHPPEPCRRPALHRCIGVHAFVGGRSGRCRPAYGMDGRGDLEESGCHYRDGLRVWARPPSSRGEFHPPALTDPYVNLSVHTALVVLVTRLWGRSWSRPNGRSTVVVL